MALGLQAPWVTFVNELEALFDKDPEITVDYDADDEIVSILVDNADKADALTELLPAEIPFGNIVLTIEVIPANKETNDNEWVQLFKRAFAGNPIVKDIVTVDPDMFSFGATYILFSKEVVQFFNDDLSDYNGLCSTLYEDIADDVLGAPLGVYYCTNKE